MLANWSIKVANLLLEEDLAGTGTRVLLDLPEHWRTAVWALGTWLTGGCVAVAEPGAAVDVAVLDLVVTDDPGRWPEAGGALVAAVPLASFALRWPGALPAGILDGAADVAAQPDTLGPVPAADPDAPALAIGATLTDYAGLASAPWFAAAALERWSAGEVVELG